jgi:co-chaperonin GroES (HSP10)
MGPAIKLMGDKLLLTPLPVENKQEEEEKTPGGLFIPAGSSASKRTQSDRLLWATVVKVGSTIEEINEGDIILFDKMSAADLPIDGELYTIIRGSDLIAVRE